MLAQLDGLGRDAYGLLLRHGRCHSSLVRRPGMLISTIRGGTMGILPQRNAEILAIGLRRRQILGS
jgi:hypothetical protein